MSEDGFLSGELSVFGVAQSFAGKGSLGEAVGVGVGILPGVLLEGLGKTGVTANRRWVGWLGSG